MVPVTGQININKLVKNINTQPIVRFLFEDGRCFGLCDELLFIYRIRKFLSECKSRNHI